MADIFISYASENRDRAHALVEVLEAQGWSVWWDRQLKPGPEYDTVIQRELREAGCVIVLWSADAVESRWVRAEAEDAAQRKLLVPALLERVEIPLGFRMLQAADLSEWEDGTDAPGMRAVLDSVRSTLRRSRQDLKPIQSRAGRRKTWLVIAAAIPLAAGLGLSAVPVRSFPLTLDLKVSGLTFRTDRTTSLLGNPLRATRIVLSGLAGVDLPGPGRAMRVNTEQLVLGAPASGLTFAALVARDTGLVSLAADGGSYVFDVERAEGLTVLASGAVDVRGQGIRPGRATFDGDPIGLVLGSGDLAVTFWPAVGPAETTLVTRVPIRGLAVQIQELHALGATSETRLPSTVIGGAISSARVRAASDTLAPGQTLNLDVLEGVLTRVALVDGVLRFAFEGRVRDASIGDGRDAASLRPSVAGWLVGEYPIPVAAAVFSYLGILVGILRWRRRL